MKKAVLLYAGQGSQRVGMGLDFYEMYPAYKEYVDNLPVNVDTIHCMHEGPLQVLSQTENTQVGMAVFAAGVTKILKESGIEAEAACGLSLGEYGALMAAGVFTPEEYVKLSQFRGRAMMEAAKGSETSMSAILAMDSDVIRQVCEEVTSGYVTVANYNCPGQTVLCGGSEASITELGIGGFTSMKALSFSEDPLRASIPFDAERNGFVMGEGGGALILEEYEHAKKREAKI